ncbi:MAG: DUF6145 family protein [Lachnospiraceae bacterium]|nr:DUF6145 family protein [Lachnospiraceae bacterium]
MFEDEYVLCAASAYTKQYYFNPAFDSLPESVQEDLNILCVLFTEEVGGNLILKFDEEGTLLLETSAAEEDLLYDEIGSGLKIKEIQQTKADLLESLEMFFRVFFLGEEEE